MANVATKTIGYWLPLITAVLGFAAGGVTEWMRDRRFYKREREARASAKRDIQIERSDDFQRKTLLELQDLVVIMMQIAASMQRLDVASYRKNGRRDEDLYPEDLTKDKDLANVQSALLGVRVRDAAVRDLLQQLKDKLSATSLASSIEESESAMQKAGTAFAALNSRIGEILRSLDAFE